MMHNDWVEKMCKHVALLAEFKLLMQGSEGGMSTICETQKPALRLYNSPLSEQGFFVGWAAVTHHYSYYAILLILRYTIHITHTYTNYSYYSTLLINHILNHITH